MPPALEMAAEKRERGKLVSGDNCEARVVDGGGRGRRRSPREALQPRIVPPGRYVFEAVDANAQTEEAGGEPSPPALGCPAGSPAAYWHPVWQRSSEAKYKPCRTEQYEHDCPGTEPFPGRADSEMASKKDA